MAEVWFEIHWRVPAENAVGGKSYWTTMDGGTFDGESAALEALARLTDGEYRLVKIVRETIAGPGVGTKSR